MAAFTSVYFQEFEPLMIIVRNALVDAEELYLERQRRKVSKKTSREGAAALESRWIELQTYKFVCERGHGANQKSSLLFVFLQEL